MSSGWPVGVFWRMPMIPAASWSATELPRLVEDASLNCRPNLAAIWFIPLQP